MKLADWLTENKVKRVDFAKEIGVQPSVITAWCDGVYKPGNKNAARLAAVTGNAVTLLDFIEPEAEAAQ